MRVREAMSRSVRMARPSDTIRDAAEIMAEADIGFLPVGDDERLLGMITDRDIAVRAVARGKGPETAVSEVMSAEVKYCFEDDDVDAIAHNMAEQQLRRLPVVNRQKRLVGVISLGDLAIESSMDRQAAEALSGISRPGGPHSQTAHVNF